MKWILEISCFHTFPILFIPPGACFIPFPPEFSSLSLSFSVLSFRKFSEASFSGVVLPSTRLPQHCIWIALPTVATPVCSCVSLSLFLSVTPTTSTAPRLLHRAGLYSFCVPHSSELWAWHLRGTQLWNLLSKHQIHFRFSLLGAVTPCCLLPSLYSYNTLLSAICFLSFPCSVWFWVYIGSQALRYPSKWECKWISEGLKSLFLHVHSPNWFMYFFKLR